MDPTRCDIAVIGGGIVGLSAAMALAARPGTRVAVLEAESRLATHQSGHNSGVIHSGLYYRPGSLRARMCVEGRRALLDFCAERAVPYERCGKVVVATRASELPALDDLERRGRANGLEGLKRFSPGELREREPHVTGIAALLVPETGIVDFERVSQAFAERVRELGGTVETGMRMIGCRRLSDEIVLETTGGAVSCRVMIGCAGLQADRVARMCGVEPEVRIAPFRGEYIELAAPRRHLVRHLIYPVPDPRFPFLGVHFTRRLSGQIEVGPSAVLALARHGYRKTDVSLADTAALLAWPGFWRMGLRHWRTALSESRALRSGPLLGALRRLVPELEPTDIVPGRSGVRAMALGRDGALLDDFHVVEGERMIHVLNAPSPAATASFAIGRWIAARALERLG